MILNNITDRCVLHKEVASEGAAGASWRSWEEADMEADTVNENIIGAKIVKTIGF